MTHSGKDFGHGRTDVVEALLKQAAPRPLPPAEDARSVREAVHAEWLGATRNYRVRRRLLRFALAATVLLAVAITWDALRTDGVAPLRVAAIGKSHGPIYVLGDRSGLHELNELAALSVGQAIRTGEGAGIGLTWRNGGGALRIDERTQVDFTGPDGIFLRSGRVYFDSRSAAAIDDAGTTDRQFRIGTEHGTVAHLGTQFMASVSSGTLSVSVREGEVTIERGNRRPTAYPGQQLRFAGGGPPNVTNIRSTGEHWQWVEATAPTVDFSGRSTHEFLQWVGRETGLTVVFTSPEAEQLARNGRLIGAVPGLDPRGELEVRMMGEDLDYEIDEVAGTINVSAVATAE